MFCEPIGHVQERGDYQYSWQPQKMRQEDLLAAQKMAEKVTADLGGSGIFGVEFFVTSTEVIFSELSPLICMQEQYWGCRFLKLIALRVLAQ